MFEVTAKAIDFQESRSKLADSQAGGFVSFEGWVRNHNEGRDVDALEYDVFDVLAVKEGCKIVQEALDRFDIKAAYGIHRKGFLEIGELAVYVGVSSAHRQEAFEACRYIIDEVKTRLPIWKKEHYTEGPSEWVNCQRCQEAGQHHRHEHQHGESCH